MRELPDHYVPRPRLVARLEPARIAAVQAGGGYGKSVLAAEFARHLGLPTASVVLEARDADPAGFVSRLRTALARVGWSDLAAPLSGTGDPADEIDGLLAALAASPEARLFVLDDVHHAAASAGVLARLLAGLPRPHRALVLGRRLPRPVEDLVLTGDAVRLDGDTLAFTSAETVSLYGAFGVALAEHDAHALQRATAGWAAALVLACPRLARGEDVASEVAAITVQGAMLAHLVGRDLAELEPADRTHAAQVAHLPLLSEQLVDSATESPGVFGRLLGGGIPLSPGPEGWYELPGPVREYLTGFARLDPAVARRAAQEYAACGETVSALDSLLAAGLDGDAAALLAGLPAPRLEQLDYLDIVTVVDALAAEAVDAEPRIVLHLAHACEGAGRFALRAAALERARAALADGQDPPLAREIDAEIARDLVRDGRPDEAEALAGRVLAEAGAGELPARARALDVQGRAKAWRRDAVSLQESLPLLEEAYRLCLTLGRKTWAAQVVQPLATAVLQAVGRLDDALDRYIGVLSILPGRSRHRAVILTFCAAVLHDLGRYDEAAAMLNEAKQLSRVLSHPFAAAYAAWEAARGASQQGDAARVVAELEEAERQRGDWFDHWSGAEFLAEAADSLGRVGETERAFAYLARALERVDESPVGVRRGQGAVLARSGDPAEAEEILAAVSREERLTPAEAWRVTLLRAYAAKRRGDPAAARLAAEAFDAAAGLGYPELPLIREPRVAEAFLASVGGRALSAADLPLLVSTLGRFEVTHGGRAVELPAGRPTKLVKLLVASGGRVLADEAIELLWPGTGPDTGRQRLRNLLNRARTGSDLVARDGEALVLSRSARVDAALFEEDAAAATAADAGHRAGLAQTAVARYLGEFLPDDRYEDWAAAPRERLRRAYLDLLDLLAGDAAENGDLDQAIRRLEEGIAAEPLDESRYLRAAELLLQQGRRGTARGFVEQAIAGRTELGLPESPRLARLRGATRA